jgi:hypothetical protein
VKAGQSDAADTLNRVYVCDVCLFGAREPRDHGYQYPRPGGVPGFHKHTAAMMSPFIRDTSPTHAPQPDAEKSRDVQGDS